MQTKVLVIGVIKKGDTVLMRKKPDGSPPYKETWYLFGGELTSETNPDEALQSIVRKQTGIEITLGDRFRWDYETKVDLDGIEKFFVYLDVLCEYKSGEPVAGEGIERLEWIPISELANYDLVPPSIPVLKKLGYL